VRKKGKKAKYPRASSFAFLKASLIILKKLNLVSW
jgi:hypothetical protein